MRNRLVGIMVISVFIIVQFAGCYDAKEVTEYAYALSIGLDKGSTDVLRLTVQLHTMKNETNTGGQSSGGSQGGGEDKADIQEKNGYLTVSIDCPTFYVGVNMLNSFLPREINYMHTKYLIFSESLAREGIGQYLNGFLRGRQIRRTMNVIVTRGEASEFIKNNTPVLGSALSKTQENMMQVARNTGYFTGADYGMMVSSAKAPYYQSIAILAAVNDFSRMSERESKGVAPYKSGGENYAGNLVRKGGSRDEFFGTAVFDGEKMVGELDGDETRAMLLLRGEFKRGFFSVKDPLKPETTITVNVSMPRQPSVKISFSEDRAVIDIKVSLIGEIQSIQSSVDYEKKNLAPILEEEYRRTIKEQLDKTIRKCQDLNTDVFKLGSSVAEHFLTIREWERYNWLGKFRNAMITTNVEFSIKQTGTMLKSVEIYSSHEKNGD